MTEIWDEASKQAMLDNPVLIRGLNEEMQMGRFDVIQGIIEQNKMLGKTGNKTDLEMYQEIATAMNMANMSKDVNTNIPMTSSVKEVQNPKVIVMQKKQAGIAPRKKSEAVKKYDPAKLSDEEFIALMDAGAKFI